MRGRRKEKKMTDKIIDILKASDADGFEITDTTTLAYEFYFIKHRLDQNRVRDVEHINVKVYKKLDDGKMLGSASGEIYPTLTDEEIKEEIDKLISRAENVKNPFYELNKPEDYEVSKSEDVDVSQIAENFVKAMKELPETDTEYINSYEIFAEKNKRRFINSEGIDISFEYPSSMVEVVVNARDSEHEIELYRMYKAGSCDSENLKKDIAEVLRYGKDKLIAKPTPKLGKAAVVFPTSDAVQIYSWFVEKCNAGFIYSKYSDWEIGKEVAPRAKGDKVTLKSVKYLPNSSKNFDVDDEGAVIRDMTVLDKNVPTTFFGGRRFRYYLGIKDSYLACNFDVEGGSKTSEEIRSGKYLEIVEFSDFAVDSISGDIAGEIRLGYYHDGEKVTPVSGGSISGCMTDFVNEMYMSKEKRQYDNFNIPALTRLENVSVTGVE
ncbi:metallopeptidase TldD-related protein [Butyrivibrio sp. ob235]|uniref:metallopeptidase TldD-related protein n=1 Tax=Butyrivibrio sp. ob235 TaxID=1761780 RepID=UPI001FA71221|nr:metallopeptidase TldD-related protein [Butyrivibrio sp. ob235]